MQRATDLRGAGCRSLRERRRTVQAALRPLTRVSPRRQNVSAAGAPAAPRPRPVECHSATVRSSGRAADPAWFLFGTSIHDHQVLAGDSYSSRPSKGWGWLIEQPRTCNIGEVSDETVSSVAQDSNLTAAKEGTRNAAQSVVAWAEICGSRMAREGPGGAERPRRRRRGHGRPNAIPAQAADKTKNSAANKIKATQEKHTAGRHRPSETGEASIKRPERHNDTVGVHGYADTRRSRFSARRGPVNSKSKPT